MNNTLSYSIKGLSLTKKFEGFRSVAYQDQHGIWTIGYGHTNNVRPGDIINRQQAEAFLIADIKWAENAVKSLVTVPLSQEMFDALVDFTFNVGIGNFKKSTLLAKVNNNDFLSADAEFNKWDKIADKVSSGLHRRRIAESQLFEKGIITKP